MAYLGHHAVDDSRTVRLPRFWTRTPAAPVTIPQDSPLPALFAAQHEVSRAQRKADLIIAAAVFAVFTVICAAIGYVQLGG